jgi:hypothetical protein
MQIEQLVTRIFGPVELVRVTQLRRPAEPPRA